MAISVDEKSDSVNFAAKYRLTFPLLTDPGLKTALAYGVAMKGRDIAIPSVFVIDRGGRVVWRYIGETMTDRPHSAKIIEILKQLQR